MRKSIRIEILYLAILAFGINLCFAFQISNLSSIFKFLGADNNELPLLWLIPPLTGLIIQPLVGQMSDDTVSKYGKRRPYIIVWGLIAALSLCLLSAVHTLIYVILLTWMVGCSLNAGAESLRALTGDVAFQESECSKAFALQAFFSGIGGALGTSLPFLLNKLFIFFSINDMASIGALPNNLRLSFILIAIILVVTISISMRYVKERPYTRAALLQKKKKQNNLRMRIAKIFIDLYKNFKRMPTAFRKICWIHATTWVGIFIFWLYFTVTLAQNLYHLPLDADISSLLYAEILQKANLDSLYYFSIYQYVSVAYAALLYFLSNFNRIKLIHVFSLLVGGVGMLLIGFVQDAHLLTLAFVAIGIMWGSMVVLPYAIAIQVLPKGKIGAYLGIFNICITAPQILCGLLLSPIFTYIFQGQAPYLLVLAGTFILLSAYFWFRLGRQKTAERAITAREQEVYSQT